jgi:alkylated DNA repair dioxygenase AlkB
VELQRSLFAGGPPAVRPDTAVQRVPLGSGAWIDTCTGWLAGADDLLDVLAETVAWQQGRRRMYDRVLDDPRLSCRCRDGEPLPHPVLGAARVALGAQYGVRFGPVGLNYYRDGRDSVAPHADRELRVLDDTLVAVLTLGARRPFLVRPTGGGPSVDLAPASGDLLVMGGSCQRHFQHAVPKVARCGPRISATWRFAGTRAQEPVVTRTPSNRSCSYSPSGTETSTSDRARS